MFHAYVIFNVVRIMYYLMYSCSHLMNTCVLVYLFVHIIQTTNYMLIFKQHFLDSICIF